MKVERNIMAFGVKLNKGLKDGNDFKFLTRCLTCDGAHLKQFLDLGSQPLANALLENSSPQPVTVPLKVMFCEDCTHSQLDRAVNAVDLFSDYKYVSGTTDTLKKHFQELAEEYWFHGFGKVLDIGCNDGSLLEAFRKINGHNPATRDENIPIWGVDPAENLRESTKDKGLDVLVDFWSSETALKLDFTPNVITALNCLAHNSNPYDFLVGCQRVLATKGVVVIEFPYHLDSIERVDLGQYYHEHHSYFSVRSFMTLAERTGFYIFKTTYFPKIHGGTLRFSLKRGSGPHSQDTRKYISETEKGIKEKVFSLQRQIDKLTKQLSNEIIEASINNTVYIYGASAKISTLLNLPQMKEAAKQISGAVDENSLKHNLYIPGGNIKINHPDALRNIKNLVLVIGAHNFKDEIIKKLKEQEIHCTVINYTPEIVVEKI